MVLYFFDIAGTDTPLEQEGVDLPDREMARQFAIGLAETIMRGQDKGGECRSRVTIRDVNGEILDEIHSVSE